MFCKGQAVASKASFTVLELGCGDGRLLRKLVEKDRAAATVQVGSNESLYVGIEYDNSRYDIARSLLECYTNVKLLNGSFEVLIHEFPDSSIDKIISVLPDPEFIDTQYQDQWKKFYSVVHCKLSTGGCLRIVTELIDDLLQPVTIDVYNAWVEEIIQIFRALGYSLVGFLEGSPADYESECLDRFKKDPQRIRLVTFDFTKKEQRLSLY